MAEDTSLEGREELTRALEEMIARSSAAKGPPPGDGDSKFFDRMRKLSRTISEVKNAIKNLPFLVLAAPVVADLDGIRERNLAATPPRKTELDFYRETLEGFAGAQRMEDQGRSRKESKRIGEPVAFATLDPFTRTLGELDFLESLEEAKTKVDETTSDMAASVREHLVDELGDIYSDAIVNIEAFENRIQVMADEVVNRSIIPDMIEDIGDWFGKLDGLMVEPTNVMTESVRGAFGKMGDGVANIIGDMVKGAKFNFDSLRDLARTVIGDLQSTLVDRLVVAPLRGGFGSILDDLFPRASGGDVSGGKPFLVGERGPELFVPDTSGVIQPHSRVRDRMEATINFNIDARGADRARIAQMEHALITHIKSTPSIAIAAVNNFNARRR